MNMETHNMENIEINIENINFTEEHFDSAQAQEAQGSEELQASEVVATTFEKEWDARYVDLTELSALENREVEDLEIDEEEMSLEAKIPSDSDLEYPALLEMELDYFHDEDQEDKLWQARTGLNKNTLCGAIETIIFMNDKPVALSKIKSLIDEDLPLRVIHEAIERLQNEYEQKHHGIRLQEVAEGYQFRTKATYSKFVQDLFKVSSLVLTPSALEVLAIIAYKQPVAKTEVDKIRGVDSSHIVRQLMDKRLVKVNGRSDEMGRPVLYGTTPEFLEVFNLADLSELPPEHELEEMSKSTVGKISDIKTIVHAGDKEQFKFDEIDELDALAESIKAINADTDFTNALKIEEKKRISAEGEEVKSAFDLLEEYVEQQLLKAENMASKESDLFTAVTFPEVISDLTAGPFNVPEEEDDEFEMIDLETGEAIIEDEDESSDEDNDDQVMEAEEFLLQDDNEKEELAKALDDAFERLTGEKLQATPVVHEGELEEDFNQVDSLSDEIDQLTDKMASKARDLDIDLDWLNGEFSQDTEITSETDDNKDL
ncbi:MAG: SMC-Scp complex subunit ScpB [Deltaproteobacteria bacterium]|nr:MAG: SMC-Scp complex subunit ScpB [Deltaproteobacteria bacterium]